MTEQMNAYNERQNYNLETVNAEKAVVVGVNINNNPLYENSMTELENLAIACQIQCVARVEQNLKRATTQYYVGSGKVDEIRMGVEAFDADLVIFNHELTPSQMRNLEKALSVRIVDRTNLILEIFERRAQTREAKLQVEAAHLKYLLPRLIGSYEALGRQSGGVGTKNKGVGEKKLELDRRKVEQKIHDLNREIDQVEKERITQRKKRADSRVKGVALVGYTNAGKSTLMNAMLDLYSQKKEKKVFEKDMLFATLETSIRQMKLPDKKTFTLSDTVGFVSELPHDLVKAFRATLEEVKQADLLLHVVDLANPDFRHQMKVTLDTLAEIDAADVPMLTIYNKADIANVDLSELVDGIVVSAKTSLGIETLVDAIKAHIFKDFIDCEVRIPMEDGKLFAFINEYSGVSEMRFEEESTFLQISCSPEIYEKLKMYIVA